MKDFVYKKSLGQNFIIENNIVDKIVKYADIDKDTLVIEIGPGSGNLSKRIIPQSGFSILYEIDTRLENVLFETLQNFDNFKIIFNDFLKQDVLSDISNFNYKKTYVVANLPYYITSPIITKLMNQVYPDRIIIMVQKEVADRICAKCGTRDYGMFSVLISAKYDVRKLFDVSKNCFYPAPNVDSAVICLDKKNELSIKDSYKFEKLIKDAFKYKRKNLKNNLINYDLNIITNILCKYNLTLSNRAEDIDTSIFVEISNSL